MPQPNKLCDKSVPQTESLCYKKRVANQQVMHKYVGLIEILEIELTADELGSLQHSATTYLTLNN